MQLPKFHETFIPILQILKDGGKLHYRELSQKVRDNYYSDLPKEILNSTVSTGENRLLDRIGWAKSYLKFAKLVDYPERAMVEINDKGIKVLKEGKFTFQDLKKDSDYITHLKNVANRKKEDFKEGDLEIENSSPQELIDSGIKTLETSVKSDLLEKLRKIDPYYFERVILLLLEKMGYGDFSETKKSNDGGIDGIINKDKLGLEKIYIQAKRYNKNKVREKDIRDLSGAMTGNTEKGIFVNTSTFDERAINKAEKAKIILIDGSRLVDLMNQYNVGVQITNTYEVKKVDEDFFEGN